MNNKMELKKATRQGVIPLIGIYGLSGSGKTMSSLLMARGFVGDTGSIGMIDTESGRGSLYADVIPNGYQTLDMTPPFSSKRYVEAMETIEKSCDIGIIDSMSHEWEGEGGVLDWAGDIEKKSGKPGLHCWKEPKLEHNRMMLRLLQSPIPWIVCLRAHYKSRQIRKDGKTQIVRDENVTPIQDAKFIYEMTAHGWIGEEHGLHLTKCSHPDLRSCFPDGKITVETGKAIAGWCEIGKTKPEAKPKAKTKPQIKKRLWKLLQKQTDLGEELTVADAEKYLRDAHLMAEDVRLKELGTATMREIANGLEGKQ